MPTAKGATAEFATITVSNVAIGLGKTLAQLTEAEQVVAIVTVEDQEIRFRYDGTDPTAGVGHVMGDGDAITLVGPERISRFMMIRKGVSDATVRVTFDYE